MIFLNKYYAQAHSPGYADTPRAFLLSFATIAPPHALLVAHWGTEGAAVLSLPTREYFQSSGWVQQRPPPAPVQLDEQRERERIEREREREVLSVRSGSDFWAGRSHTPSSSAFTAERSFSENEHRGHSYSTSNAFSSPIPEDDEDSDGTETPDHEGQDGDEDEGVMDEVGAQDAFVAGMIYALSRRVLPGPPYTPAATPNNPTSASAEDSRGRWRLDECLRFATELAGRKARRRGWDGLANEMVQAGWFES